MVWSRYNEFVECQNGLNHLFNCRTKHYCVMLLLFVSMSVFAQNTKELDEVTVVASRTTHNAEGYITSLRGSKITKGKTSMAALAMLPSVSLEEEQLKINGMPVSEIYVNDMKLTDRSELTNIPGEMIDKVQVRYVAGSNQNAALSGGVIMITLRRPKTDGYYGSVSAFGDWQRSCGFGNGGMSGLINYQTKNLSIYDNLYVGWKQSEDRSNQTVEAQDALTLLREETKSHGFGLRNRLSIVRDFKPGSSLGGSYLFSTNRFRPTSSTAAGSDLSVIANRENIIAQEGTLRFGMPLGKRGESMMLTADYYNRHANSNSAYYENADNVANSKDKSNLNLWKATADFSYPCSRSLMLQWGAFAQIISSHFTPTDLATDDRFPVSDVQTKTTGFTPNVYVSAKGMTGKLRYSVGLSWQLNRIKYEDVTNGVSNSNTQWSLNPTIQMMMPFGKQMQHALMLNYKHTLSDIPYSAISSVLYWDDAYNYSVGNPDLKAMSSDMVIAGVSLFRNKLNLTAIYAHTHNRIWWETFRDEANPTVCYTKPVNISGQGMWGFGAEWNESPLDWWNFKLSGRVEIVPENLTLSGIRYDETRLKEYFSFSNNITLKNGWGGMINAVYEPTYHSYDRTYHGVYNVNGQVYKTFCNDKLQLSLNFNAFGNRRQLDRRVADKVVSCKYTAPVQRIGISLVWNFSGGKKVNVNTVDGIQDYKETKDNRE